MPASYNDFQRELNKLDIDPKIKYIFTLIYEQMSHIAKQQLDTASAVLAMANTVSSFADLHEATQKKLQQVLRDGRPEGIEVHSEDITKN